MDSHADTCAVGDNFVMLKKADHFISVHPFAEEYKPLWNIPIATGSTVWTHSDNESYVLVFHKVLFFGSCLQHSLICPNQLHANCLTVHHVSHQFDSNGTHSCRILGLTALNSLLQYVNWLVWEIVLSTEWSRKEA